jgi:hypothetical protein
LDAVSRVANPIVNRFDVKRIDHIFLAKKGHVNPLDPAARQTWIDIFERVASNKSFLRPDAVQAKIITQHAADAGVQAYTWTASTGQQVWVAVRQGLIQDAGVNLAGAHR